MGEFIISLIAVLVGSFMIFWILKASKNRKINDIQTIMWVFGAVLIIILGMFPQIVTWVAGVLNIFWPPAVIVFLLIVILFMLLFNQAKTVSTLGDQVTELTIQVSLLKHENEQLKNAEKEEMDKEYVE